MLLEIKMNRCLEWLNWCVKKEKIVIEGLDELGKETKNIWDDMIIKYIKRKIIIP